MAEKRVQRRLASILAAECGRLQPAHGRGRDGHAGPAQDAPRRGLRPLYRRAQWPHRPNWAKLGITAAVALGGGKWSTQAGRYRPVGTGV